MRQRRCIGRETIYVRNLCHARREILVFFVLSMTENPHKIVLVFTYPAYTVFGSQEILSTTLKHFLMSLYLKNIR